MYHKQGPFKCTFNTWSRMSSASKRWGFQQQTARHGVNAQVASTHPRAAMAMAMATFCNRGQRMADHKGKRALCNTRTM